VIGKGWVAAGDLVVGDEVHTLDGDAGIVAGLKLEKLDKSLSVYNLEVKDFQSYFVGEGVLVHNKCSELDEYKKPIPPKGGKSKDDVKTLAIFSKIKILRPKIGETPRQVATRILNEVLPDGYDKGPKSIFNQLVKYFAMHFE
jgi:hypothetical protein